MPSIAPIRKKTLSDSVKDSLRKLISEKAFNEAGKLPPEEELARQLAVSRITIRKALTDLEQEGLLLRIHGRGTFVNPAARQVKVNLSGMLEFGSVISGNGYRPGWFPWTRRGYRPPLGNTLAPVREAGVYGWRSCIWQTIFRPLSV